MATATQYNPNGNLNRVLLDAGLSKTVYALITPETEEVKAAVLGDSGSMAREMYMDQFREAWTGKQDRLHHRFFDKWVEWSAPVVEFSRESFPFYYPTAGASEPLRQIIFARASAAGDYTIHVFEGEYEGYKAMAEASGTRFVQHKRKDWIEIPGRLGSDDLFCISAPSAIDGMVWGDFNDFLRAMPENSVIADVTYVGAVPKSAIHERFKLDAPSVRNIVFSLSKPFGLYYDRVGGVFSREEDLGLFGNKWFKNLTSITIGLAMMERYDVFYMPDTYGSVQKARVAEGSRTLCMNLVAADVFLLATALPTGTELCEYLYRAGKIRVCLTPGMAHQIGTAG